MTKTELRDKVSLKITTAVANKSVTNAIIAEILNDMLDIVELDPYKVLKANLKSKVNNIAVGTPFIIGQQYIIRSPVAGDDFSNIGFIEHGTPFVAVATTPNVWTTTNQVSTMIVETSTIFKNTLGAISIVTDMGVDYLKIVSPNPIFPVNSYYVSGASFYYIDDYSFHVSVSQMKSIEINTNF